MFFDHLKLDSIKVDEQGFLRGKARIARSGVQEYYEGTSIIRRLRSPLEVEKSAVRFNQAVVTLNHPPVAVNSENIGQYQVGHLGNCIYDHETGWVGSDAIVVTHAKAVKATQSTHKELSCGYDADLIKVPGVWIDTLNVMGGGVGKSYPYDEEMINIRANHLALVEKARAGSNATIHDSLSTRDCVTTFLLLSNH